MNIKGKHTIPAQASEIWSLLNDSEVLARITPGISELEPIGEDRFKTLSEIRIGPVRGAFTGDLEIRDKVTEQQMVLSLDQQSKIGNAKAEIKIELTPSEGETTTLSYDGSAKLSGTIARLGQRIVGGVVNTLSKQFFSALEKELNNNKT